MSDTLPAGWVRVLLSEIADAKLGKMLDRSKHTTGRPLPYLRNINVRWGDFDLSDVLEMYFEEDELERYEIRIGDVVVCEGGEPGRAAVWDGRVGGMKYQKALHRVRPGPFLEPTWLVHQLRHDARRGALEHLFTGTTIKHFTGAALAEYEVTLPPPSEQKRILVKLEELTARSRRAKQALDAVPSLLDQLRQSILAAAFRGDLTADWRAKHPSVEPADKLLARIRAERRKKWEQAELARMQASEKAPADDKWKAKYKQPEAVDTTELSELPEGWCWASVDDVSELQLGQQRAPVHAAAEETYPYIRAANITWKGLDLSDVKRMGFPDPERYLLREGDVLLNEASGSATEVGKPAIWRGEVPDCCYQKTLLRVRPVSNGASCDWLHLSFLADALLGRFARMAPGVGILHLTADRMLSWPVPLAPLPEQQHILKVASRALRQLETLEKLYSVVAANVASLERSSLAKAFRGELVPQDPNDEPASVLLERIRAARGSVEAAGAGSGRRSRKSKVGAYVPGDGDVPGDDDDDSEGAPQPAARPEPVRYAAKDLSEVDPEILEAAVFAALWTHGPLEKDDAVRRVAEHLRKAGHVDFQRLRADGPLYGQVLAAIESAAKAGRLDRPKRGHVRACKADATAYTADDWRCALVASLGAEPVDRDDAIRAAAEWARDHLGLEFARLRGDGHIVEGLRSAINSAIRRGEVIRHNATHISRAASSGREATGQLSLTLDAPAAVASRGDLARNHRGA